MVVAITIPRSGAMTTLFTAIYEGGVLRPIKPIDLPEGQQVEVLVLHRPDLASPLSPAQVLAEIAALPMEPSERDFSGRDHDRILYGNERGAQ
jgi:predicted DNA-binding antitoxin AbrB/MazE fold protein